MTESVLKKWCFELRFYRTCTPWDWLGATEDVDGLGITVLIVALKLLDELEVVAFNGPEVVFEEPDVMVEWLPVAVGWIVMLPLTAEVENIASAYKLHKNCW